MTKVLAVLGLLLSAGALGQKVELENTKQVEARFLAIQSVAAVATCSPKGTATLGVPLNGFLGIGSCSSFDPTYGTFYGDFYTFSAIAGRTLKVSSNSSLSYVATVQDYTTGSVLADSGTCGSLQDSCSFTYQTTVSGQFVLGIGAYAVGSYSLTLTDITAIGPPTGCSPTSVNLCLSTSRFKVSVTWASGPVGGAPTSSGPGTAISMTSDTGYFWFFDSSNVECVIKVLDARGVNNHFWVFAAGMTNVSAVITVTDTQTGAIKTYTNPQGVAFQPVQDTLAF